MVCFLNYMARHCRLSWRTLFYFVFWKHLILLLCSRAPILQSTKSQLLYFFFILSTRYCIFSGYNKWYYKSLFHQLDDNYRITTFITGIHLFIKKKITGKLLWLYLTRIFLSIIFKTICIVFRNNNTIM